MRSGAFVPAVIGLHVRLGDGGGRGIPTRLLSGSCYGAYQFLRPLDSGQRAWTSEGRPGQRQVRGAFRE